MHATCTECPAGWYNSDEEQYAINHHDCARCPPSQPVSLPGATFCMDCPNGWARNTRPTAGGDGTVPWCEPCTAGRRSALDDNGTPVCSTCPHGFAQPLNATTACDQCSPGRFAARSGQAECATCPIGFVQENSAATNCTEVEDGFIVLGGGSASVQVPLGSRICGVDERCAFSSCDAGTKGTQPPSDSCEACPAGTSSFPGAVRCTPCAKGKFNKGTPNGGECSACPVGFYQPLDTEPSTACTRCPAGYTQAGTGGTACASLKWVLAEDCGANQYLDDRPGPQKRTDWRCTQCMAGGSCAGDVTRTTLPPLFGWWKIPPEDRDEDADDDLFAPCLFPPACLGAPNPALEGQFFDPTGKIDLALEGLGGGRHVNATTPKAQRAFGCNTELGFRNHSRLCQSCADGFARTSGSTCTACSGDGGSTSIALAGLALAAMLVCFMVMVGLRINSYTRFNSQRRRKAMHSTMKRILLTHVQTISLVMGLSVPYPPLLEQTLSAVGSLTSFSESVSMLECGYVNVDHAKFYHTLLVVSSLTPLGVAGLLALYWFCLAPTSKVFGCGIKVRSGPLCILRSAAPKPDPGDGADAAAAALGRVRTGKRISSSTVRYLPTTADTFLCSVVLMWFLLLPSLLRVGFIGFECQPVGAAGTTGGANRVEYLVLDLEQQCWVEGTAQMTFALFVGMPMLLAYGLVLPAGVLLLLRRAGQSRLTDPSLMLRWGLFFSGYRAESFWFEGCVLARKYSIILVSTFVTTDRYQLQAALGILAVALHLHDVQRPFGNGSDHARQLHRFEMTSLVCLFFMLWAGVYFSMNLCDASPGWCSAMVVLILASNVLFVLVLGTRCCTEWSKRNRLAEHLVGVQRTLQTSMTSVGSSIVHRIWRRGVGRSDRGDGDGDGDERGERHPSVSSSGADAVPVERISALFNTWTEYETEDGDLFYWNEAAQESRWDRPEGCVVIPLPREGSVGHGGDNGDDRGSGGVNGGKVRDRSAAAAGQQQQQQHCVEIELSSAFPSSPSLSPSGVPSLPVVSNPMRRGTGRGQKDR